MRILHLDTEMTWRGGENQLRLLLSGLAASDAENFVVVRPGSQAAEKLRGLAPITEMRVRGGFDPGAARNLARFAAEHRIDVIDAHTSNGHSLALLMKLCGAQARIVVHRRVDYAPGRGFFNRRKYLSAMVDRYVAISSAIAAILADYGIPPAKIAVVRSAIDGKPYEIYDRAAERAALASAFSIDQNLVFLGNVSALSDQKDYPTLIRAAKILKERGLPFHVFVAGEGERRDELERLRMDLGMEYDVTFLGFIDQVPRFLSALDVFAMSSAYEGLGTILLEAAHAGLCLVATAVGGIPEAVVDGKSGILCPPGDPEALANALARVINDPRLRRSLAEGAKQHVNQEFSLGAMVGGNLELYRDVLRRS